MPDNTPKTAAPSITLPKAEKAAVLDESISPPPAAKESEEIDQLKVQGKLSEKRSTEALALKADNPAIEVVTDAPKLPTAPGPKVAQSGEATLQPLQPTPKETTPAPASDIGRDKAITPAETSSEKILMAEREALILAKRQEAPAKGPLETFKETTAPTRLREPEIPPGPKLDSLKEATANPITPEKKETGYDRGFTPPQEKAPASQIKQIPQEPAMTNRHSAAQEDRSQKAPPKAESAPAHRPPESKKVSVVPSKESTPAKTKDKDTPAATSPDTREKLAVKPELKSEPGAVKVSATVAAAPARTVVRPQSKRALTEKKLKAAQNASEKKVIGRAREIKAYTQRIIHREIVRQKIADSLKAISHDVQRTISQSAVRLSPEKAVQLDKSLQKAVLEKLKLLLQSPDLSGRERALLRELKHILLAKRSSSPLRKILGGARGEGRSSRKPLSPAKPEKPYLNNRTFRAEAKKLPPALRKEVMKVLSGARLSERQALKLLKAINGPGGLGLLTSSRTDRMLRKAAKIIQKVLAEQKLEDFERLTRAKIAPNVPAPDKERESLFKRALQAARKSLFGQLQQRAAAPPEKQETAGLVQTIYGNVIDGETGQPVPGVLIDAGELGTVESDENGFYEIPNVASGTHYTIRPGLQLCTFSPAMQSGIMGDTPVKQDFKLYW